MVLFCCFFLRLLIIIVKFHFFFLLCSAFPYFVTFSLTFQLCVFKVFTSRLDGGTDGRCTEERLKRGIRWGSGPSMDMISDGKKNGSVFKQPSRANSGREARSHCIANAARKASIKDQGKGGVPCPPPAPAPHSPPTPDFESQAGSLAEFLGHHLRASDLLSTETRARVSDRINLLVFILIPPRIRTAHPGEVLLARFPEPSQDPRTH